MKGFLCAGLLALLQAMSPSHAFEADIHFSATYVLARAVGWAEADALTIASANEGVDENLDTVAALEMDTDPAPSFAGYIAGSLRQAEKNLRFHCFSRVQGPAGRIPADVLEMMSEHYAAVPAHSEDPRKNAQRLIALGVALHCQQDAHSHVDFGGTCGTYAGTCYGHTHQSFFDQLIFRLTGKHYFNPDHPGVSGQRLLETLRGTAIGLAAHRPGTSARPIGTHELKALADALRVSGLELTDQLRRECNRYIAGKWLFELSRSGRSKQPGADGAETLRPEVAITCKNASLASATVMRIPDPRFPRLNPDASASLVKTDGTYRTVRGGAFDAVPGRSAESASHQTNYKGVPIKVQLSHWTQLLALPPPGPVTLSSAENNRKAM